VDVVYWCVDVGGVGVGFVVGEGEEVLGFGIEDGFVKVVDGILYMVDCGEMLGIVGELGFGKLVFLLIVMGLIWLCNVYIFGKVCFNGEDLLGVFDDVLCKICGDDIVMIF